MYKNPSFLTTCEIIRHNTEKNKRENMTVACLISYDGTMVLYDSIEELLTENFADVPDQVRIQMLVQYLMETSRYFFHISYEYIPQKLPTSEMEARIMMWREALSCQGITVTPANKIDHSGKSFMRASQLIELIEPIENVIGDPSYCDENIEFLKDCNGNALVDKLDYEYNNVPVYCFKLADTLKDTMRDPTIIFKDHKNRPAVIRRNLHDFLDVYAAYMRSDPEFEVFIYPDGTAANMSGGYSNMEVTMAVSDEELNEYICSTGSKGIENHKFFNMDDTDRFMYRLQVLRIICIVGADSILMPYPITPQQSVFLEGLQEFGAIFVTDSNVKVLTDFYRYSVTGSEQKIPLPLSNGFMFGGTPYFRAYPKLSPEIKRKVDSVMNISGENHEKYLFDTANDDRLFAIKSEAEL